MQNDPHKREKLHTAKESAEKNRLELSLVEPFTTSFCFFVTQADEKMCIWSNLQTAPKRKSDCYISKCRTKSIFFETTQETVISETEVQEKKFSTTAICWGSRFGLRLFNTPLQPRISHCGSRSFQIWVISTEVAFLFF